MFEGFDVHEIDIGRARMHTRVGGSGPPLLLIHGYPQTHHMWHAVAPPLAEQFTVVAPDLPGYGASTVRDDSVERFSKRELAHDLVTLMGELGHERFDLAGHDRGARVAYRMALDHPDKVGRLATLDIMPTLATWERLQGTGGLGAYHWYFLAQPFDLPERLIGADPAFFLRWTLESWAQDASVFDPAALAAYERAFAEPAVIHSTCQDYRAGATVDVDIDRADRAAGRPITAPMLVLWGDRGGRVQGDTHLQVWREWADDVRGGPLACGHFLAEEAPDATAHALLDFLA